MIIPPRICWVLAAAIAVALFFSSQAVQAFSDTEIDEIFKTFDENGDGKVDRTEFDVHKISIIYRNINTDPIKGVAFEQTMISRQFFDTLDTDHNGLLRPIEIHDGLPFERIAGQTRGYFEIADLRRFMQSISR